MLCLFPFVKPGMAHSLYQLVTSKSRTSLNTIMHTALMPYSRSYWIHFQRLYWSQLLFQPVMIPCYFITTSNNALYWNVVVWCEMITQMSLLVSVPVCLFVHPSFMLTFHSAWYPHLCLANIPHCPKEYLMHALLIWHTYRIVGGGKYW